MVPSNFGDIFPFKNISGELKTEALGVKGVQLLIRKVLSANFCSGGRRTRSHY